VKWNLQDLEGVFNGGIRALAQAGVFGTKVTGIADATDLATTERYRGCGQVTRKRRIEDKRGRVQELEVTVYGWKVLLLIDAVTKIPLAVKVAKIHEHEALWTRAMVTQAQANLAGVARLHKVVFDKAFLAGTDLWWLDQHGIIFVVPAKDNMAVTADARALATAYRLRCEREAVGEEPVGWQRWRRQLHEQTLDYVIVFAQSHYGIFHIAEYSLMLGVKIKDVPPDAGSRQQVLTMHGLPARG